MDLFKFWAKMIAAFTVILSASAVGNITVLIVYPFRKQIGPKLIQKTAKIVLWIFRIHVKLNPIPDILHQDHPGVLIVSNHCCSLDIPVLAATFGSLFVSKKSVLFWPFIGSFAWLSGVLFLDRDKMGQRMAIIRKMAKHIEPGVVISVFPQGTTASNKSRLPFYSGIFKVVELNPNILLFPVSLDYDKNDLVAWENESLLQNARRICALDRIDVCITPHAMLTGDDYANAGAREISKIAERTVLSALS